MSEIAAAVAATHESILQQWLHSEIPIFSVTRQRLEILKEKSQFSQPELTQLPQKYDLNIAMAMNWSLAVFTALP